MPTAPNMFSSLISSHGLIINIILGLCLAVLSLALLLFSNLTSTEIFFCIFLLTMFAWNIDARVSIAGALFFLVIIPILLILNKLSILSNVDNWTEQIAIWIFYLLTIGVSKQIWENYSINETNDVIIQSKVPVPSYLPHPTVSNQEKVTVTKKPQLIHDIKPPRRFQKKKL